jgi:hypothetical protein
LEKRVDKNEKLLNKTQQNDKKNVEIRWSFDFGVEGRGCWEKIEWRVWG